MPLTRPLTVGLTVPLYVGATGDALASVSVSDLFNRADSTTGLGLSTSGHTWIETGGTFGILSNQAKEVVATSSPYAVIDSGISNATVAWTMAVLPSADRSTWHPMRFQDAANMIVVEASPAGGPYYIYKKVAGIFTALGNGGATANGAEMRVVLNGTSIKLYVDNALTIDTTASEFLTNTKHGIGSSVSYGSGARWDNFSINPL